MVTVNLGVLATGGGGGGVSGGISSLVGDVVTGIPVAGVAQAQVVSIGNRPPDATATGDTVAIRDVNGDSAFNTINANVLLLQTPSNLPTAAARNDQVAAAVSLASLKFFDADGVELNNNLPDIEITDYRGFVLSDGHVVAGGDRILLTAQGVVADNLLWECDNTTGFFIRPTGWEIGVDITGYRIPIIDYTSTSNRDGWIFLQNQIAIIGTVPPAPSYVVVAKGAVLHGDGVTIIQPVGNTLSVGVIGTSNISDGAVTTAKLANNAVTTAKLAPLSVTTTEIADLSVTTAKLVDLSVTTTKINDTAVTTAKLANNAVTTEKIASGAVTTAKLAPFSVTTTEIALGAVITNRLGDLSVTNSKLADNSVGVTKILDGNITSPKLSSGAVTTDKIAFAAVTSAKISAEAVTSGELAASAVTLVKLDAGVSARLIPATASLTTNYLSGTNTYLPLISNGGAPAANTVLIADNSGTSVVSSLLTFSQILQNLKQTAVFVLGGTPTPNTVGNASTFFVIPMQTFTPSRNTGIISTVAGTSTAWSIVIPATATPLEVSLEADLRAVFGGGVDNGVAAFEIGFSSTAGSYTQVAGATNGFVYNMAYSNSGGLGTIANSFPTKATLQYRGTAGATYYLMYTGFSQQNSTSSTTITVSPYSTGTRLISYFRITEVG